MAVTKRAGRTKVLHRGGGGGGGAAAAESSKGGGVKKATYESSKRKAVGVDDLTLLSTISNDAINDNLKKRFASGEIYTYIGHVLISVNPFRDLGIYTDDMILAYRGKNRLEVSPHVFAIAEGAYYQLKAYNENQCVIISGESGAGKTEASKRIMQYIASVSEGGSDSAIQRVKDTILATNPLLESFGCAKTLRNNNSSRHGKYLEIEFNRSGAPIGAHVINYLLEKSRIVGQIRGERNFHIFYQFTKAAPQKYREAYGIQGPESYLYTSLSQCYDVEGIDDRKDFAETIRAMDTIGIPEEERDEIFRMLAIVLWTGNLQFRENAEGNAEITDPGVTDFLAYLLGVDSALVNKALTTRIIETQRGGRRGSIYDSPLNTVQATAVRDALAKGVYNNLFDWMFNRVNESLTARGEGASQVNKTIGILDIYGFEIFEQNSFEQLCINYVNEKLQQIFIQLTLKTEQEEYVREQIKWTPIDYFNNKIVCDLIEERRPPGIFAALNDAIATAHADSGAADNAFAQRLSMLSTNPHFEARRSQFIIKHYAGDVMYTLNGMTDRNKDQLQKDLLDLFQASSNHFLLGLFPDQVDPNSKRRPPTAGDKIKLSANDLVNTLMQCQPSYIRTIKPNSHKSPTEYDDKAVLHQIKYLGLQENVRIRRAGFAYRQTFEKFVERFYLLSSKTSYAGEYTWRGSMEDAVRQIFRDTGIPKEEYQLGVSKAFIKRPETLFALESMRDRYWHTMATRIQRAWRRYLRYRNECATRIQRMWLRSKTTLQYVQLRDQGHQLLGGRKERRKFSLVGQRRYLGDYIGCNLRGGIGQAIMKAVNITDHVEFSARCDILISKFGRSSKPAPRQLIMTQKMIYIVVTIVNNRSLNHSIETSFPVSQVKYVSMTNLQDDWMAIGLGSSTIPDPLIDCIFKTEFAVRLKALKHGLDLRIGPTIEYAKKPGKMSVVKAVRDEAAGLRDNYKSGAIHVATGMSANSVSKATPASKSSSSTSRARAPAQTARSKPKPNGTSAKPATARKQAPLAPAGATSARAQAPQAPTAASTTASSAPRAAAGGTPARAAAPPPPPPPPAAQPAEKDLYIALYDFAGRTESELSVKKDDIVKVLQGETGGWCLGLLNGVEGWVPANYIEPYEPKARAPPPPPPAAAATARNASSASGTHTPTNANIGNLADALRQRASLNRGGSDAQDDDW